MEKRKVIYYTDEKNDEFSRAKITPKKIDENYVYIRDSFWGRLCHFFWYRVIATPLAFIYLKLKFGHKIVGREKLLPYKKTGVFLFGNHTQDIADACIPSMLVFPKDAYLIVHPNNVSMAVVGRATPYLGALPLPDTVRAHKSFVSAIQKRASEGEAIFVYPEAHIWPYYTKIRDFSDTSFAFAVRCGTPVFAFTNTYQKRPLTKEPRIVTYIDGPFFPDSTLSEREARAVLRDEVLCCMKERAKLSTVEKIRYIKREDNNE